MFESGEPVSELRSIADSLHAETLAGLPDARIEEDFAELHRGLERLETERLRRLAEIDRRGLYRRDGYVSAAAWLVSRFKLSWGTAREQVRLARGLSHMPVVSRALEDGELALGSARVLMQARDADPDAFASAERTLLEAAMIHSPGDLQRVVTYWRLMVEAEHAADPERRLRECRRLHASASFGGMVRLDGDLDPESGETVLSALHAVIDSEARSRAGEDQRTPAQRRADALVEICRQWLDRSDRPMVGGERPHLTVTIVADALANVDGPGRAAELDHGGPVPASTARRIACDAPVMRVVLSARSEPLDVGRRTPVIPPSMRRAVIVRDRRCRFPGCDRPHSWCDAHHVVHWADGGPTTLSNLLLLCRRHHRLVHRYGQGRFSVEIVDGHPIFRRPDGSLLEDRAPPQRAVRGDLLGDPTETALSANAPVQVRSSAPANPAAVDSSHPPPSVRSRMRGNVEVDAGRQSPTPHTGLVLRGRPGVERKPCLVEVTVTTAGSGAFVGRERELTELSTALQAAIGGRGALFLIAGEPGIGKSRLADEFAERARGAGGLLLWGRCWEAGGAPTYWPWVEAIRTYLRETDAATVREHIGGGAAEIAQMIPEVEAFFPGLRAPNLTDPEAARFRLFDGLATFLRAASVARPILLILDDFQSADAPSLLLLRFVARVVRDARILILCLYRDDAELAVEGPLLETVAQLRREPSTRSITLTGLDEPDVTRFIDRTTERVPPASLVSAVYEHTDGNPLFVAEVVRLLVLEGRLSHLEPGARLSIPATVREVIGRRLALLTDDCAELLSVASVIGQEFDVEVLAALAERPVRALLDVLDEATRARVLTTVPAAPTRRRFAHALFREALYEEIPGGRRIDLHHRTAQVLEAWYGVERDAHLAELAHHFFLAIPDADPAVVVEYAKRAGDVAAARLAFEESVRLYGVALRALELTGAADGAGRCTLLLDLGDAQARSGDMATARATFLEAASIANRLGRAEDLGRAAVGYGGRFVWQRAGSDRHLVPLLEGALEAIGEVASTTRVRLLSRLACALRDQHDRTRSDELSALALEIARGMGDPRTLAYALDGRYGAIWWPENPRERLELADEMVGLGQLGVEGQFQGHHCRVISYLELGEIGRAELELEAMRRLAEEARQPWQPWVVDTISSNVALVRGRFGEAEQQIIKAHRYGASALLTDAESHFASLLYTIHKERGHAADEVAPLRAAAARFTWYPFFHALLSEALLEIDEGAQARSSYARIRMDDFSALPRDNEWLFALSVTSPVCVAIGDKTGAEVLYELQLPYADRHAYGHAEGQAGSVSRALGILAAFLDRLDDAERHFEDALRLNKHMGARPWVAHTQHSYARMLVDRDLPGDREHAVALLEDASGTCEELGMVALGRKVAELLVSLHPSEDAVEPRASQVSMAVFRREGEYWTVVFDGNEFRLRDSKGVRYLAELLSAPGREIHALDLARAVEGRDVIRRARTDGLEDGDRSVGPALDKRAKGEYRRRLAELDEELAEAEEWNDPERASRLRVERDFVVRELAAAVGLGGRDRPQGSDAERARVNVTRAIRGVLERIAEHYPELGRHLTRTVRTGSFCSYQPDPFSPVSWST